MRRREFIAVFGSAAVACPLPLQAQHSGAVRRIGMLHTQAAGDPESQARIITFVQALEQLGWTDGRNVRIDARWSAGNAAVTRKHVEELVGLSPDVILTGGIAGVMPLLQATRSVPIVFVLVADPVGAGIVDNLARPGGNVTGFTALEYAMGSKWLELLKELAPGMTRTAVIRDPTISVGIGMFGAIQSAAATFGVEVSPVNIREPGELERSIDAFAGVQNSGLIVTASPSAFVHRDLVIRLAERHKLPAVYPGPGFVSAGGLAAYGPDIVDQYRRAAVYVDRILKGAKPVDLPVQTPTKYQFAINLKTAKALGLSVPPTLLARADEVIE